MGGTVSVTAWIAVAGMLVYRAAFSMSLGPLPYIMTSEFFPQEARASGVALSWFSNWASNAVVSLTAESLPGDMGIASIFSMYVVFCLVAYVFALVFLPETKGLALEAAGSLGRQWSARRSSN